MSTITGIKWPLQFHNGRVAVSSDEQHIKEGVRQIIGTAKGEVPMRPDFGCDVHRRVFDPVNVAALAGGDIRAALLRYEPRVNVTGVRANLGESHLGIVRIEINYTIKGQDEPYTASTSIGG